MNYENDDDDDKRRLYKWCIFYFFVYMFVSVVLFLIGGVIAYIVFKLNLFS